MSSAEMFLMAWAILSTVLAVFYSVKAKFFYVQHNRIAVLLGELAFGDIKPVHKPNGYVVVENEELVMSFKKKEEK